MRVLILHSAIAPDAPPDEQDTLVQAAAVEEALHQSGHATARGQFEPEPERLRALIAGARADLVFNLVESVWGRGVHAPLAAQMLDDIGIPFTGSGAGPMAATGDKLLSKRLLRQAGLRTPEWSEPPEWNDLSGINRWIVKSVDEDASLGLDDGAVVTTRAAVRVRAAQCCARYGGRWFAERFIEGREFNVAILERNGEPHVLPVAEMQFLRWDSGRPRIVGYAAKWDPADEVSRNTVRDFKWQQNEPELRDALTRLAEGCWQLFGCRGYARVDFRVDDKSRPYILEVNTNPCLDPEAGYAAAAAEERLYYAELIEHILTTGFGVLPTDVPQRRAAAGH